MTTGKSSPHHRNFIAARLAGVGNGLVLPDYLTMARIISTEGRTAAMLGPNHRATLGKGPQQFAGFPGPDDQQKSKPHVIT